MLRISLFFLLASSALAQTIVSTAPSFTEILYALGLGDKVAGVSQHCHYPPAVQALPRVGSYIRPNVEAIARLKPAYVLVNADQRNAIEQLKALGIQTVALKNEGLPELLNSIREIAKTFGIAPKGEKLVDSIQSSLNTIEKAHAGQKTPTLLFVVGRTPGRLEGLVAVGKGSFLNELIRIAGGRNVLADSPVAYPRLSLESVHRLNPDVIVDMGDMAETTGVPASHLVAVRGLWATQSTLEAVQKGHVFAVAADIFVVPGPRIAEAAQQFANMLK